MLVERFAPSRFAVGNGEHSIFLCLPGTWRPIFQCAMNHDGIWMRLYISDYLNDTIGLTHAQHGAYLLSIMKYWTKGESLTNTEMKEVCGREYRRVVEFYIWEGNRWHHKRIDVELKAMRERVVLWRDRASNAARARWNGGRSA